MSELQELDEQLAKFREAFATADESQRDKLRASMRLAIEMLKEEMLEMGKRLELMEELAR